jgi:nicotinamidase-related amidase
VTQAVLVIDMIVDFVTGKLGFEKARAIVPTIRGLLEAARSRGVPVVYSCDSHRPEDPELRVWGEHAMAGTEGAKVIPELAPKPGEPVLPKCTYSAFFGTGLDEVLRGKGSQELVLVGVVTDICIKHSAADALFRGYRVTVLEDCTAALDERAHRNALDYMRRIYGARLMRSVELIEDWRGEG